MAKIQVADLQRKIERTAAAAGPEPAFPQLAVDRLVPLLREHHTVEPRPLLIGRTAYERVWVRINRVVRRVAAHALEPAVAQQNEFNTALLDTIEHLIRTDAALRAAIIAHRAARAEDRSDGI